MSGYYTAADHFALLPALMLVLFGSAILLLEFLLPKGAARTRWLVGFTLLGLASAAVALLRQQQALAAPGSRIVAFSGALTVDSFSMYFDWMFLAAAAIVTLISYRYLEIEGEHRAEYYGLILLACSGMFFLASGSDLITLFLGLELMALSFYVLVGFLKRERRSNEAAIKYFLLGSFSSGLLAYGFSLLYGLSGSTNLEEIRRAIFARGSVDAITALAIATILAGLLFKISAAPFHMWAPDAYAGAPTAVTAYLSVASQAASFALLLRIFNGPLSPLDQAWRPAIAGIAVLTLVIGNFAALTQENVKRLIAYSSVSHAGYLLLGLVAGNATGLRGIAVYLAVYTFANLGVLMVLIAIRTRTSGLPEEDVSDLNGLAARHPLYAAAMLVFLLSLAGIPPTGGFLGKYYIFLSLLETGHAVLAVIAALYVAVSLYYYFRIVRGMYMLPGDSKPLASSAGMNLAVAISGLATLLLGLFPEPFLKFAAGALLR